MKTKTGADKSKLGAHKKTAKKTKPTLKKAGAPQANPKKVLKKPKADTIKKSSKKQIKKEVKKTVKKPIQKITKKPEPKKTKQELKRIEKQKAAEEAARQKTFEEELEEKLTDEEIQGFKIERVDMEKLTNKVCVILAKYESDGMFQNDLWKKLKISNRDGSRLALKLERTGIINRVKLLQKERWTYKLILKKTPISTVSIENAPCLVCPVEQKCTLDGEVSPRTCQWIDNWVIAELKRKRSK